MGRAALARQSHLAFGFQSLDETIYLEAMKTGKAPDLGIGEPAAP
ncbi:MAG: hypothetical protein QME74_02595 [Candidatus Edwardsbacteria bacterium]|nr:hypothetical protein [Candidatus Edwardsbacteria bacterium]